MSQPVKIVEVMLKDVDLTLFEEKTLKFGFPVDPPQFVYHPAAFTDIGTFYIHPQKYLDPKEASAFLSETMAAGFVDPDIWMPLIEFNLYLQNGERYAEFIKRTNT